MTPKQEEWMILLVGLLLFLGAVSFGFHLGRIATHLGF